VDERFIIFEVRGQATRGGDGAFGFNPAAAEPPEAEVHVAELSPTAAADERRRPNQILARPLPTRLIEPVSTSEAAQPTAAGTSWGVEAVRARVSPFSGSGIKVAVLDTGVDADHAAFQGVTVTRRNFTGEADDDEHGHGTHCAGTIVGRDVNGFRCGVANGVTELLAGKVLGDGGGSTDAIVKGIQWAVDGGANVISMSLGIDFPGAVDWFVQQGMDVRPATSRALKEYRDNLRLFEAMSDYVRANSRFDKPAIIVAATGNESARKAANPYIIDVSPPAASEGFIAVGAVGQAEGGSVEIAGFSNAGATVVAPGVDITSAWPGGELARLSGTSMATPHVAGVAALWAEKLKAEDGEINVELLTSKLTGLTADAQGLVDLGRDDIGSGLVQAPIA
jgi:subtilisin family serine protease